MKTSSSQPPGERGTVLLVTLTLGIIMALASISYLLLVGNQKSVVTRSQTWNAALAMAEAGVEEAMAQINASPGDFSENNWPQSGNSYGPVSRTLMGGSYSVLLVGVTNPVIYSTGYTTVPITGDVISRAVKVKTSQIQSVFNVAFAAVNLIQLNGSGIASDSWNSHNPAMSTNGQYDPSKTSTNGNVASVQGAVDLGNHIINGSLYLGPTATYNNSGTVNGTVYTDFNVNFPDVTLPAGAANWPIAAPATITTYTTNVSNNGTVTISRTSYQAYDFKTTGNYILQNNFYPIVVEAGVTVNLNVTASSFSPPSLQIHGGIVNSGSAALYFNGPTSATIAGNTAIDASNRPENLRYFGLPSLTSLTYSGTSYFIGVIYAPEAAFTLNGGGNNNGVMGSAVVNTIVMNGHYNFHYDESLANLSVSRGFIATSWQELY